MPGVFSIEPVTYLNIGSATGFLIAGVNVESFNVYNGDSADVLLISRNSSPTLSNSIPVQPLTNGTITGKGPWYASAQSGNIASLTVSSSAQLSPSPAQVAAQVAAQQVGIALYDVPSQTLPDLDGGGNAQFQNLTPLNPVNLTGAGLTGTKINFYNSYEIVIQALAAATGIVGACQVLLTFYNQVTDTIPIATVKWFIPANNPGAVTTVGQGPMRGNFMAIQIASQETAGTALTTLNKLSLTGSLRTNSNGDYWQSDGIPIGLTPSGAKTFSNELLIVTNVNVPASGTVRRGVLLYAGKATLTCENQDATGTLVGTLFQAVNPASSIWHGALPQNSTGTAEVVVDLILDRVPLIFSVTNNGAAAGHLMAAIIADRV